MLVRSSFRAVAAAVAAMGCLLSLPALAQVTVTVLHSFDGDLRFPAGVGWGVDGYLYGTYSNPTAPGGAWRLDAEGANLSSQATADIFSVTSPLIRNGAGTFYGTAQRTSCPMTNVGPGGVITADYGTVFRFGADLSVTPVAAAQNRIYCPQGNLSFDAAGNLYVLDLGNGSGTMTPSTGGGDGALWKISADESTVTLVRAFAAATDGRATVTMIAGENDWLYGVNSTGGPARADQPGVTVNGTVYRVRPDGSEFSVLHSFVASEGRPANTAASKSGLVEAEGYLYGSTFSLADGNGSLYRLRTDGSDFRVLHRFSNTPDGRRPAGELIRGGDGNIYGTTNAGGVNGVGSLFRIVVANSDNVDGGYEQLHSFTRGVDGTNPGGRLARGANGKLYLVVGDSDTGKVLEIDIGYTPPQAQILSFSATPAGLFVGASTTLRWTTQNVDECIASGDWSGAKAANGEEVFTSSSARDYSFSLACAGDSNSADATIVVTASVPPPAQINSFTTSHATVPRGANITLSWQAQDTSGCSASGSWSGARAASGSENITFGADGNYTYHLTCAGRGGDATRAVNVTVTAPPVVDARSGGGSMQPVWLGLFALLALASRRRGGPVRVVKPGGAIS